MDEKAREWTEIKLDLLDEALESGGSKAKLGFLTILADRCRSVDYGEDTNREILEYVDRFAFDPASDVAREARATGDSLRRSWGLPDREPKWPMPGR